MELSRRKVPLYGQAKVFALLEGLDAMPGDVEVFIVLEGSTLLHFIKALSDVMLCFIVPGHNLAEVVSVQAYLCSETTPLTCLGGATLEYVQDDAQDLAEHLVTHGHRLSSMDHKELSSVFRLGQRSCRWAMDQLVALAMANLDIPQSWNVLGSPGGEVYRPRESPLHLAVRWGLVRLAEFLLCQPGGLMAVLLPNEDGVTPLQLAQLAGNAELQDLLENPPNPLSTPPAGLTQVWAGPGRLLRFCHDTGTLSLTVRQNGRRNSRQELHADILLLRERFRDDHFLKEIRGLRRMNTGTVLEKEESVVNPAENGMCPYVSEDISALAGNDCEEPLMFCLNGEDEERSPTQSDSEKGQPIRKHPTPCSTSAAAARLSAMIHGKDRVYANAMLVDQVDDVDIKYRSPGQQEEEEEEEEEDGFGCETQAGSPGGGSPFSRSPPVAGRLFTPLENGDGGPPQPPVGTHHRTLSSPAASPRSPFASSPSLPSSPLASAFRLFEGHRRQTKPSAPLSPGLHHRGVSLPETVRSLSPSVECGSGDEDILCHSYPVVCPRQQPSAPAEDKGSGETLQDYNQSLPDSTHRSTQSQEGEAEVRLRSYSYSSPKAKPTRPLLNREAAISDLAEEQRAYSLTETNRDKRIEDEEDWDKYIIPSKVESEKYKVSRTFSFLKSRMSSTRSKAKVKEKEVKEGKQKTGGANGHQFVAASGPPGPSVCVACDRPVPGKDLLQCFNCSLSVHKSCRDSVPPCGKKPQDKNALSTKGKASTLPQNSAKDTSSSLSSSPSSSSSLNTAAREKRETAALSKSLSISTDCSRRPSDVAGVDGEAAAASLSRSSLSEETMQTASTPPSSDPVAAAAATEEPVDTPLFSELSAVLLGLEVESWSLAVSSEYCRLHDKRTIKRQDVIYELMQTELHHIQTLTVMAEVFRRGMLEELQLDWACVARVFPCLDPLLLFHRNLFGALQERRHASSQAHQPRDYLIQNIGDLLLQQFSEENAEKMKQLYGDFCSHHTEAVNLFKELQQQNKKLQLFVKQQSNKSLVKRREVPEFILLVTQRITKYPVLLERILQYSQEGSQDYADLSRALFQIRDIITAVDLSVSRFEKDQELQEVLGRLENKSLAKLKNDKVFRKQDLRSPQRGLQHKGLVYWKTATGRLKDTLALLLTDVLVFLQEKDQRYVFAAVDQKPPVIPLQKLIVREVANEERGMFLISASSVGPEMYEVHTATREERNAWMRHIRHAVESCPEEEEEEERSTESEEARRASEARVQKIQKFQESLLSQDQQICSTLEEKLQLYAELTELTLGPGEPVTQRHLLVSPETDADTPRQASTLLTAAVKEAERLLNILQAGEAFSSQGPENCSYNSHGSIQESPSEPDYLSTLSVSSTSLMSDGDWPGPDGLLCNSPTEQSGDVNGTQATVAESVQSLTQLLYSLQAVVTLQDSYYEVQKVLRMEGPRPQPRIALQNNQDHEKQRSLERKREDTERKDSDRRRDDVDGVHKLHARLKQDQQLWDRECLARDKQQTQHELLLEQREQQCHLEAERLRCERKELDAQLLEYQQNVDRLWEGQRSVEREKERVEAQQLLLQSWKHSRQSSLPVMIPLDGYQVSVHSRSGSLDGSCSVHENEAPPLRPPPQQNNHPHHHPLLAHHHHPLLHHHHHHHHSNHQHESPPAGPRKLQNNALLHSPGLYNSLNTLLSQALAKPPLPLPPPPDRHSIIYGRSRSIGTPGRSSQLQNNNNGGTDLSPPLERVSQGSWRPVVTGLGLYEDDYPSSASLTPLLSPQAYLALDGQSGEEGEENIVYL
ncbi:rho guanine nucleotide exchange factor 28 isoform X3 [Gadus morhua]|uniref:Rho guanine nucleotide exchange factor 28-like n=1 Tax=Gadus morhua TaxID=8049 RepID=A0A8C4Z7X0_GADMO|nr:rho guanine nucleotide exchange factor 28-like isoform X3 [Gadus morhua]